MSLDLQNLNAELRELNPPQVRDRLIFEAVALKNRGQCDVAAEHGISQPRVSQIVVEVGEWLDRVLPGTRRYAKGSGGTAVGTFIAETQIDSLMEQTMHEMRESKKDKVTEKSGRRGDVQWTEIKTVKGPVIPVGLLNVALRLAQAKAKLAGVDISGRTQRELAIAEERERREAIARGQESEGRGDEEVKAEKLLIKKGEKHAAQPLQVQPQVQMEPEDTLRDEREVFVKNRAMKQLINHLRENPQYADWSEKQFQEYAQFVWDDGAKESAASASDPADPHPGPLPKGKGAGRGLRLAGATPFASLLPGKSRKRQRMPSPKIQPPSPQERRREFLVPQAAG